MIASRKFVLGGSDNITLRLDQIIQYSGGRGQEWTGPYDNRKHSYLNITTAGGTEHRLFWSNSTEKAGIAAQALRKAKLES